MVNDPLEQLIKLLSRLPGVGVKTATRLAFHLVTAPKEYPAALAGACLAFAPVVEAIMVPNDPRPIHRLAVIGSQE